MNDATEELRALLDGRGVSHVDNGCNTAWTTGSESYAALEEMDGSLSVAPLTPAQAVEVTLGCGECEQVLTDCDDGLMPPFTAHCSNCKTEWGHTPKFCPECGAQVTGTRDERKAVKR